MIKNIEKDRDKRKVYMIIYIMQLFTKYYKLMNRIETEKITQIMNRER
jgi:hypothetical protein